ncbi:hypothetical protein [Demequina zhanjiangensis]|uniref:Coenzyme PQQ synthesis protein D (PqqD) n=1 Tax=Demequina zhanjiangensis TaxID=3051659 RepID=A0ABT8FYP5_9MICO|nr:hypothetical protein [Demequina sp. SYSU T00b26]MDN4472013.1 hypothetical protein [Demequina sp. SYSU T00b26]
MTEPTPAPLAEDAVVVAVHEDAVERDGEMLVLVGSEVVLLSAVATALVGHAHEPADVSTLATLLVEEFGAPPSGDPFAAVCTLAGELVARGVLEQR